LLAEGLVNVLALKNSFLHAVNIFLHVGDFFADRIIVQPVFFELSDFVGMREFDGFGFANIDKVKFGRRFEFGKRTSEKAFFG